MRGKRKTRKKQLEKAGWVIVEEREGHGGQHCLVLHHLHGKRNARGPADARAREVIVEAATRSRAYARAARMLVSRSGRTARPVLP